ncbi:homeodomain-containing protein [Rhizobium sullae]|uniref:Homeodomain-containing protein n=1 Tax=Rhizobium sullae TaxID=50338 RepID=A0A4R3PQ52_RHISU|nr:homeodomain-containing protein [Rhizobium sullae]
MPWNLLLPGAGISCPAALSAVANSGEYDCISDRSKNVSQLLVTTAGFSTFVVQRYRMRTGIRFDVAAADRARLEAIVAAPTSAQKRVWRARITLMSGDGSGTVAIMDATGKSKTWVWRWQERFMTEGVDGLLHDKSRPPGIAPVDGELVERIVALTLETPQQEATHWTVRAMAKAVGIAASSVVKIWHEHSLAPHRWCSFKLSNDKAFAEKLHDVVGLYVSPPAHAFVLSVDEKSQIQALDRTQPGLPLKKWRAGTMTHDHKRHGTTCRPQYPRRLGDRSKHAASPASEVHPFSQRHRGGVAKG